MSPRSRCWFALTAVLLLTSVASAQQAGSIRGVVYDTDFDAPLPRAQVLIVETGERVTTTEDGNFVFPRVLPGTYTIVFSKEGYAQQVKGGVVVSAGALADVNAELSGEFTEMDEFVVQDLRITGTEAALLKLRMDSPALMDSISAELMSQAGVSDAASALRLVAGATVEDGKYAVIRGLPDRYVSSQLNGVRLPTADEEKRAVQLDQFPTPVIESIRVTKSFTPDQQGDASGGAVNVVLKGIPDETILQMKAQVSYNTQVSNRTDFLTYKGGGFNYWGNDEGSRDQQLDSLGQSWEGAVGTTTGEAPIDYKWSIAGGGKHEFDGITVGGFGSFFYEADSAFFDNGQDNSLWVAGPGSPMSPQLLQNAGAGDFKTALFDVTQGTQLVQWGGLGTLGIETKNHLVQATYLYTQTTEDTATLAEDTRGKEYFFPDYEPDNPASAGNLPDNRTTAPYIRTETLEYTERMTQTFILNGKHTLSLGDFGSDEFLEFHAPEVDWTFATSSADLDQPDKRQFGELWWGPSLNPGFPPFIPPFVSPAVHRQFQPEALFTLGNLQRIWKQIEETSTEYAVNLEVPFDQWSGDEGYLKFGLFDDQVDREFNQDTFSNFSDSTAQFEEDWEVHWSEFFPPPTENHPITEALVDVDYHGDQHISAWYAMADLPLTSFLNVIGGARVESTEISIVNFPEIDATWFPEGASSPVALFPGASDVSIDQENVLPSIGLVLEPFEPVTLRASYAQTIALPTFRELTPIIQQEYLGGPIFIGNPLLELSSLENYDLRLDYTPYEGGLISGSWFYKSITDPIENVQQVSPFTYTTPVNYPEGEINGFEVEVRQELGSVWEPLTGLSIGGNATFIDSEVTLPEDEADDFDTPNIAAPMSTRDMTDAPEYLYNLYLTYDAAATGTEFAIFYTVKGDTLVAGAGTADNNFVPSVYSLEYDTLNVSITQKLGKYFRLVFQAKNLTNPTYDEVYRSDYIGADVLKTSFGVGIEYSIGLSAEFTF